MATVIRFARHGTKKKPYFRIVVQDHRSPRDGKFIEHIGAFNPVKGLGTVVIKRARLDYWLSTGAQMSNSVKNRLKDLMKQAQAPVAGAPQVEAAPSKPKKEAAPKKEKAASAKEGPKDA